MGGMMGSQRPGAPPSGRRGGRRGRGGRAGRGKQRYQDPKLTPHYQSFLEKYGKGQPGAASQDPYYQRNPAYEQKQPQYGPPEGGWNPQQQQQWAGMSPGARTAMQTARRQQAEQASQFQGGQYQPGPWRGPGDMPENLANRTANPIPESIFQRPYDQRPAPGAPPPGYGPGQTPGQGQGKLNQRGRGGGYQRPGGNRFWPTTFRPGGGTLFGGQFG
jgi:hypothetical protein